jgi:cytochrome c peroxidase
LAIGAFERTLIAPSRFDDYLAGKADALSDAERKGLTLFIETGCVDCHKGPGVGGTGFRKFGVYTDYRKVTNTHNPDKGRFDLTKIPGDIDKFKVPGLRDVARTPPYFHDGSVDTLQGRPRHGEDPARRRIRRRRCRGDRGLPREPDRTASLRLRARAAVALRRLQGGRFG